VDQLNDWLGQRPVTGRWYKCDGLDGSITVSICWRYKCDGLVVASGTRIIVEAAGLVGGGFKR
jgi:hypothetical protein